MASKACFLACLVALYAIVGMCGGSIASASASSPPEGATTGGHAGKSAVPPHEAQPKPPSQVAPKEEGVWSALKKAITDSFTKAVGSYVLPLLGLVVLLLIGLSFNGVLHFLYSTEPFKKLLWPPSFKSWIARRVGQIYLERALKVRERKQEKALTWCRRGFDILQSGQTEAENSGIDSSRFRAVLAAPRLAPLYALSAWNYAVKRERLDDAVAAADRALQLDPDLIEARVARGWAKLQRNVDADIGEAQSEFVELIRIGEEHQVRYLFALYGYGEALRLQGENAKAVEQYTRALPEAETLPGFLAGRGSAYHALGNWTKAVDDLTAALSRDPNNAWAGVYRADALMQLRRFDEAVEQCRKILKHDPSNQQALYVSGLALYKHAQSEQALPQERRRELLESAADNLRAAKDIAAKNKPVADIYLQLASVLGDLGRSDESRRWYLEARNTPTSSVSAARAFAQFAQQFLDESLSLLNRGLARIQVWGETRDPAELGLADEDFTAATKHAKSEAAAYSGRAWVKYLQHLDGQKTLEEALGFTRLALERGSAMGFTHYVRGWIMIAKGRFADAKTEFAAASALGYDVSGTYFGLAEAERMLSNYSVALETYTKAIDKAGDSSADAWCALRGRAVVYSQLRRWQLAFDDYGSAIKHAKKFPISRPELVGLYADFAWACYETGPGRDAEMEEAFRTALDLDQKLGYLQLQLAGVYLYSGRYDEAIVLFGSAIDTDPESSVGYVNRGLTKIYRGEPGDLDTALIDLDVAVAKNSNDAANWHTRGWARLRRKEWREAIADFNKAIELSADDPFSFNDRALARWWLQDREGALKDLRSVLEMKHATLAGQLIERVREDAVTWGSTSKDWSLAVDRKPKDYLPRLGRGISRWMAGDNAGALDDLTAASERNARSTEVRTVLAGVERELAAKATG